MILFQKNALSFNTESYCVMLTEMLRGAYEAAEAVKLSQSMIILGKASCHIPGYLSTKSAHRYVLALLFQVQLESCHNF